MKIIENFESTNKFNIEKLKEFDAQKTKVFKYITYKKSLKYIIIFLTVSFFITNFKQKKIYCL